jgi:hypothetical protein
MKPCQSTIYKPKHPRKGQYKDLGQNNQPKSCFVF